MVRIAIFITLGGVRGGALRLVCFHTDESRLPRAPHAFIRLIHAPKLKVEHYRDDPRSLMQ